MAWEVRGLKLVLKVCKLRVNGEWKWRILSAAGHLSVLLQELSTSHYFTLYFTLWNISQLLQLSRTTSHPTAPALQSAQHCSEKSRSLLCAQLLQGRGASKNQDAPHTVSTQGGWLANSCLSKAKLQWNITITLKKQRLQEYHLYLSRCSNSVHAKPRNNCKADPICILSIIKWMNLPKLCVAKNPLWFNSHLQQFRVISPSQSTCAVCFFSVCRWPLKDLQCLSLLSAVTWRERTAII